MRIRPLDLPDDRPGVLSLVERSTDRLSENKQAYVELMDGRDGRGLVAETSDGLAGYVGMAPARGEGVWALEMVAVGDIDRARLLSAAIDEADNIHATRLRWWVYGEEKLDPASVGFRLERELYLMERPLPADSQPDFSPEIKVRRFQPDDADDLIAVNNAAFADHRENGAMTHEDLRRRMAMDWFDPAGVRLAWNGDTLAGFCWTKVHPNGDGEIYIIGTAPRYQGRGLGSRLVLEGMRHLASVGARKVTLFTDSDNERAVELYQRLGYRIARSHRAYIRSP